MIKKNKYQAGISTLAAGTEILGVAAKIWSITFALEADSTATVNFSDTATAYASTSRIGKVVIDGPGTVQLAFPDGCELSNGLCMTSNVGSVDVSVTYE